MQPDREKMSNGLRPCVSINCAVKNVPEICTKAKTIDDVLVDKLVPDFSKINDE